MDDWYGDHDSWSAAPSRGVIMSTPTHTSSFAQSGDLKIHCRLFGQSGKTPIVIVHGLSYFSYDWIGVAEMLSSEREVVAIDMRGFGESDWSKDGSYSIKENSADIVSVLNHFKWSNAILLGHSLGGRYTTYCAAKNPNRVSAAISVDSAPAQAPEGSARVAEIVGMTPQCFTSIEEAMEYYSIDPHTSESLRERPRFEAYLKSVPGGYAVKRDPLFHEKFKKIHETGIRPKPPVDMWEIYAEVQCPMLVLRGTESDMVSLEIASDVRDRLPGIKLVEIQASHHIAGDNPVALKNAVTEFLAENEL